MVGYQRFRIDAITELLFAQEDVPVGPYDELTDGLDGSLDQLRLKDLHR